MTDKLQIYCGRKGLLSRKQYRARVVASNGRTLFVSGEGYNNIGDLLNITNRLFPHLQREGLTLPNEGDSL
jgi:hypothetical protein